MNSNKILCIDSATEVCSVAISDGKELLALKETQEGNRHSQWMTNFVEECMRVAKLEWTDIDAIAVSAGPGSYTGLRVGYATAKALSYQLDLPIIEVNTLRSMALEAVHEGRLNKKSLVMPMIDARRMEVYTQKFDAKGVAMSDIYAAILDHHSWDDCLSYEHIYLCGNGAHKMQLIENLPGDILKKLILDDKTINSAAHLRFEAYEKYQTQSFSDVAYCTPNYLKSPNITKSKKALF